MTRRHKRDGLVLEFLSIVSAHSKHLRVAAILVARCLTFMIHITVEENERNITKSDRQ